MVTIREWFKPSDAQLARLKDRAIKEWKSEQEIYEAFVKKWWIDRNEEVENGFRLEQEAKDKADYFDQEMLWWATVVEDEEETKEEPKYNEWASSEEDSENLTTWWITKVGASPATVNYIIKSLKDAGKLAPIIEKIGKSWFVEMIKNGIKSGGKSLWKFASKLGPAAAKTVWPIIAAWISTYQNYEDIDEWVLKKEWRWNWDWAGKYRRDAWRNAYATVDNMLFWGLPNIDAVYNKAEDDNWYSNIHSNKAQKEQKAQLKKDKETKKRYDTTFWIASWTLKDVEKTFSKIGKGDEMNARQQMSNVAVKNGEVADDNFQADFVKNNEWKTVKKKDWTTVKTWVNKATKEPVTGAITSSKK